MRPKLLLFCWLICTGLIGQNDQKIDSLERQLNVLSGKDKIEHYLKLATIAATSDRKNESNRFVKEGLNYLGQIDTISAQENLVYASQFISFQNWSYYYLKDLIKAFRGSLQLDSLSLKLLEMDDQYNGNRFLSSASTIRGIVFIDQKHYVKAEDEFQRALEYSKKLNDPKRLGWGYTNLAILYRLSGKLYEAEGLFHNADSLFLVSKSENDIYNNLHEFGQLYYELGKYEAAEEVLRKAAKYFENEKNYLELPVKGDYAKTLFALGKDEEAEKIIKEAHALTDKSDSPLEKKENLEIWAYVLEKNGDPEKALEVQKEIKEMEEILTEVSYAEELVEMQTAYINQLNPTQYSSNWILRLLFLSLTIAGIGLFFFKRKQKPEIIEKPTLKIAITQDPEVIEYEDYFLEKFMAKVNANITNDKLTIQILAKEMGFSRSQLFNKVKATTGDSPSSIIRKTRLEMAAQILRNGHFSISEVAYQVGFSNPKSFSRAFKEQFGVSPSDFS